MILYYITDRKQLAASDREQRVALLRKISDAAGADVAYVQLREKDLADRELESLAREAVRAIEGSATKLLINTRSDIALAVGAHGVHLTSNDLNGGDVRALWGDRVPVIGISCHSPAEVQMAYSQGADFAVFGPVFEKSGTAQQGTGVAGLRQACREIKMPVLALGGVTLDNAASCNQAGSVGIAGIRLFQDSPIAETVRALSIRWEK